MNEIVVKVADVPQELASIQAVRRSVFQSEQGIDAALDFDGEDSNCTQIIAYCDTRPVGVARIRDLDERTAKIERLEVLAEFRSQGIGKKIMEKALEAIALQVKHRIVKIHAQEYTKDFHKKLGFEQQGERFAEAGIPHVVMIKQLSSDEP